MALTRDARGDAAARTGARVMEAAADRPAPQEPARAYPTAAEEELARLLDLPRVAWYEELASTMDVAHALAQQGAPSGTLVLADAQSRGRGRGGKTWTSPSGAGLWLTLVERPQDPSALDVLSLRVGLRAARALDRFASAPIAIKWPNDLMLPSGKLGGMLVEVRWRALRPEWIAVGVGINLETPPVAGATGLDRREPDAATSHSPPRIAAHAAPGDRATPDRLVVLAELLPALRAAAAGQGALTPAELEEFAARDWARGRRVVAPDRGTVVGISPAGALLIETADGTVACASGSLILDGESS